MAEVFGGSDWAVDERDFDSAEGEGYEEAEVKASGFGVDEMISSVEELLKEVATLSNGSYGLLVVEFEGVHNGAEAMNAFAALAGMEPEERAVTREQLLRYCELDTYAMVKIWQRLRAVAES